MWVYSVRRLSGEIPTLNDYEVMEKVFHENGKS